jgi:hypothetical protein
MELERFIKEIFEQTLQFSGFKFSFFLIVYLVTAWYFTREKIGKFFLSIWIIIKLFFVNPYKYFIKTIETTLMLNKNIETEQSILLQPVISIIRVSVAFILMFLLSGILSTSIFVMEPNQYWVDRFDNLQTELIDYQTSLAQTKSELLDYKSQIPEKNDDGKDPRIAEVEVEYEPHKEEHTSLKDERDQTLNNLSTTKNKLPTGYSARKIIEYISNEDPVSYSSYKDVLKNVKYYCDCKDYDAYILAWRKSKLAKSKLRKFEKNIGSIIEKINLIDAQIQEEKYTINNFNSLIESINGTIDYTKIEIESADEQNNIQFLNGIKFFFLGVLQFTLFTWFIGLFEEFIQFFWSRWNDIGSIKTILESNKNDKE